MAGLITLSGIIFLILLIIYAIGLLNSYWLAMFAVLFLIVGFVVGFVLMGTEKENMKLGSILIILGILMFVVIYFFPK